MEERKLEGKTAPTRFGQSPTAKDAHAELISA
jgi:hypothetical protein